MSSTDVLWKCYQNTLKELFNSPNKKCLIIDDISFEIVKRMLTQKDLSDKNVIMQYHINSVDITKFTKTELTELHFYYLCAMNSNTSRLLTEQLELNLLVNVFIFSLNNVSENYLKMISDVSHGTIKKIASTRLYFEPLIDNIVSVYNNEQLQIFYNLCIKRHRLIKHISVEQNKYQIFENTSNDSTNLVILLDRSFDMITPKLLSWEYLNFLDFHQLDHKIVDSDFFVKNKYRFFTDVIEEYKNIVNRYIELNKFISDKSDPKKFITHFTEYQKLQKIINLHGQILTDASNKIKLDNLYELSELQQQIVIDTLSNSELLIRLNELVKNNADIEIIKNLLLLKYITKNGKLSDDLKRFAESIDISFPNITTTIEHNICTSRNKPMICQHVPTLYQILEKIKRKIINKTSPNNKLDIKNMTISESALSRYALNIYVVVCGKFTSAEINILNTFDFGNVKLFGVEVLF